MGETTRIIRRRLRHWKTTLAGVACIVCPVVAIFCPPDIAIKILSVATALGGSGLVFAADGDREP